MTVEVDDASVGLTPDDTVGQAITITDVNEAPSLSLTNTVGTLAEDTDTSSSVKVADIVITDDALGTNTLSLSGADAALLRDRGRHGAAPASRHDAGLRNAVATDVTVEVDDASVRV